VSGASDLIPADAGLLAVFATTVSPEVARTLDLGGYGWKNVASAAEAAEHEPSDGWAGIIVDASEDSASAWAFIRALRKNNAGEAQTRLLILISGTQLADLDLRDELFDDFCLLPFHPAEFEARVRHLLWRTGAAPRADVVEYRELQLNVATYQATIDGRHLDLTFMEYELLKFLAQNPGKVFTREVLLNRVWGYEYYGGARTVDVHVRRLRAKLGEEHASMIETVRSVGYRFGQARWTT
jgi:DNA-binding response OmpR family regulator